MFSALRRMDLRGHLKEVYDGVIVNRAAEGETSKLTRERVFALIAEHSYDSALVDALEHLLAAMDSEPVAYIFKHPAGRLFWALTDESNKGQSDVMPVYAEPQPAPAFPDFDNVLESLDYEVRCNAKVSMSCRPVRLRMTPAAPPCCRNSKVQELKQPAGVTKCAGAAHQISGAIRLLPGAKPRFSGAKRRHSSAKPGMDSGKREDARR